MAGDWKTYGQERQAMSDTAILLMIVVIAALTIAGMLAAIAEFIGWI
jgi:hypothetical protein